MPPADGVILTSRFRPAAETSSSKAPSLSQEISGSPSRHRVATCLHGGARLSCAVQSGRQMGGDRGPSCDNAGIATPTATGLIS